jgi:hypothetical protein
MWAAIKDVFWGICGLALVVFALGSAGYNVQRLLVEKELWNTGVVADDARVGGKRRTRIAVFHDFDLDVRYRDKAGRAHAGHAKFMSVFSSPDEDAKPEVRYDPKAPARFAVSWAIDCGVGRWVSSIFFVLVGLGVAAGLYVAARDRLIKFRAARPRSRPGKAA